MYGAIYGDLVGSLYQYREYIKHSKDEMIKASNLPELISEDSFYTEDTILMMAVLDSVMNKLSYEETIKKAVLENQEELNRTDYFKYQFSPSTIKWARGELQGTSNGNGIMAIINPIPTIEDGLIAMENDVVECTSVSHNTKEAIESTLCIANFIYLARCGYPFEKIKTIMKKFLPSNLKFDFNLDDLRTNMKFEYTCSVTLPICLYCIYHTSNFEDAIRLCLSLGGDVTTNCAIVGALAESIYGIELDKKLAVLKKLPPHYQKLMPL